MSHIANDQYYERLQEELGELGGQRYQGETITQALGRERTCKSLFGMSRGEVAKLLESASPKFLSEKAMQLHIPTSLENHYTPDDGFDPL